MSEEGTADALRRLIDELDALVSRWRMVGKHGAAECVDFIARTYRAALLAREETPPEPQEICPETVAITPPLPHSWRCEMCGKHALALREAPPAPAQTMAEPQEQLLRERAQWYRDGCPHVEDVREYFETGDLGRDAADDIESALRLLPLRVEQAAFTVGQWINRTAAARTPSDYDAGWRVGAQQAVMEMRMAVRASQETTTPPGGQHEGRDRRTGEVIADAQSTARADRSRAGEREAVAGDGTDVGRRYTTDYIATHARDFPFTVWQEVTSRVGEATTDTPESLAKVLAFNFMDDGSPSAPDSQRIATIQEIEQFAVRCLKLGSRALREAPPAPAPTTCAKHGRIGCGTCWLDSITRAAREPAPTTDLKPCPFCGGEPEWLNGDGRWEQVGCKRCFGSLSASEPKA